MLICSMCLRTHYENTSNFHTHGTCEKCSYVGYVVDVVDKYLIPKGSHNASEELGSVEVKEGHPIIKVRAPEAW